MSDFTNLKKQTKEKYGIVLDGKQDWSFYINNDGEFQLHSQCEGCIYVKQCGQSFKTELSCNKCKSVNDKSKNKKK